MAPSPDERAVRSIRRALLRWYARNKRSLPWRDNPAPFRVLVSEIMLQQTTVEAVRPRYEAFLAQFPNVASLARSSEAEVLAAWSGLGYYERARNLRRAAIEILREHGGEVPATAEALARLPGIGRYTAGAVASIAFGRPEPILDGNVARFLSRLFAVGGDPRAAATKSQLWTLARRLLDPADPSSFNQGLMEIGALVCRPREPACGECPLEVACAARAAHAVDRFPERAARRPATAVLVAAAVAHDSRGRLLLVRRARAGAMRGLWELPSVEVTAREASGPPAALSRRLREETGLRLRLGPLVASARHTVMNRKILVRAFRASLLDRSTRRPAPDVAWVELSRLDRYPRSSLLSKVLARLGDPET